MTTLDNFKTTPELTVLFTALEHYFAARDLATKARGLLHEATTGKPLALALSNADIPPQLRNAKPLDVLKWIFMAHFNMSPQVVETSSLDELTKQATSGAIDYAKLADTILRKTAADVAKVATDAVKEVVAKPLADLQAKANEIQSEARKAATLGRDCKRELQAAKKTLTNIGEDAEAGRKAAQAAAQGIGETSTGVQALLALLPDDEEWKAILAELRKRIGEKPVSSLSKLKAAKVLSLLDPATFSGLSGHTVGNWIKRGEMPKYPRFKISQTNLDGGAAGFVAYVAGQYQAFGSPLKLDPATMKAILAIDGKGSGPA